MLWIAFAAAATALVIWFLTGWLIESRSHADLLPETPLPEPLPAGWVVEAHNPHQLIPATSWRTARRRAAALRAQGRDAEARPWIRTQITCNTAELVLANNTNTQEQQ